MLTYIYKYGIKRELNADEYSKTEVVQFKFLKIIMYV